MNNIPKPRADGMSGSPSGMRAELRRVFRARTTTTHEISVCVICGRVATRHCGSDGYCTRHVKEATARTIEYMRRMGRAGKYTPLSKPNAPDEQPHYKYHRKSSKREKNR